LFLFKSPHAVADKCTNGRVCKKNTASIACTLCVTTDMALSGRETAIGVAIIVMAVFSFCMTLSLYLVPEKLNIGSKECKQAQVESRQRSVRKVNKKKRSALPVHGNTAARAMYIRKMGPIRRAARVANKTRAVSGRAGRTAAVGANRQTRQQRVAELTKRRQMITAARNKTRDTDDTEYTAVGAVSAPLTYPWHYQHTVTIVPSAGFVSEYDTETGDLVVSTSSALTDDTDVSYTVTGSSTYAYYFSLMLDGVVANVGGGDFEFEPQTEVAAATTSGLAVPATETIAIPMATEFADTYVSSLGTGKICVEVMYNLEGVEVETAVDIFHVEDNGVAPSVRIAHGISDTGQLFTRVGVDAETILSDNTVQAVVHSETYVPSDAYHHVAFMIDAAGVVDIYFDGVKVVPNETQSFDIHRVDGETPLVDEALDELGIGTVTMIGGGADIHNFRHLCIQIATEEQTVLTEARWTDEAGPSPPSTSTSRSGTLTVQQSVDTTQEGPNITLKTVRKNEGGHVGGVMGMSMALVGAVTAAGGMLVLSSAS